MLPLIDDILITDPVAEVAEIQALQVKLQTIPWLDLAYGKAFRAQRDDVFVPEVYTGQLKGEYSEVFPIDKYSTCFFDVDQTITKDDVGGRYTAQVNIIFHVNLGLAKPGLAHHASAEVREDVMSLLQHYSSNWTVTGVREGVQNVYSAYDYSRPEALVDKHPNYVFAAEMEVKFDYNNC